MRSIAYRLTLYGILDRGSLADRISQLGYDVVILNLNDGGGKIQGNAYLLAELIKQVNLQKPNNEQLVVCGFSMGGLVARYALAYM
jgi:alpha-beta hydrolase superfamily lysophospholipase